MRGQCTACNQVAHHAQLLGVGAATVLDWLHMPHSRDSVNLCNVLAANVRQPFAYLHWRTPQRVPETTSRMPASNQGHPRDATCIPAKEHMPARWDKISINPRDLQAVLFVKQLLAALSCKSKQQALVYAHYIGSATRRDPGNRRTLEVQSHLYESDVGTRHNQQHASMLQGREAQTQDKPLVLPQMYKGDLKPS